MDSSRDPWRMPYGSGPQPRPVRYLQDSPFFKAVFAITFGLAFLFFIVSIYALFNPSNPGDLSQGSTIYFFVLLLTSPFITVSTFWLNIVMVMLYAAFFIAMFYFGISKWKGPALDNPIIYYGGLASFGYLMSLVITIIELALGVSIGGTAIETDLQHHPYLVFIQLIYAPFAEELGFRIIPLGLFSLYLVAKHGGTAFDSLASFLLPGPFRKKYGIKLTSGDYVLIAATSIIFGAAHFLSGTWDPGKIVSATLVGVILAFGFVKFGIFVDIPIHWFFNGFSTVYLIYTPMTNPWLMALMWTLLSGAVAFVFLLIVAIERKRIRNDQSSQYPPDSLT